MPLGHTAGLSIPYFVLNTNGLSLGIARRLRAQLNELGNLAGVTGAVDEYPAISALGYVVSAYDYL